MRAGFVLSEAMTGLRRNITMTIAMILTSAISLGLLGGGLLVARMTTHAQELYGDRLQLNVYLDENLSVNDKSCADGCATLRTQIQDNPLVESVEYHSQADSFEEYKQRFAGQQEMLQIVREAALPSYLRVRVKDPANFGTIIDTYSKASGVKSISDQREFLNRVFTFLDTIRSFALWIALVQAIAALLLISNMVQIAAFTRRTETAIMRLVGASRWRTQLPFVIEAVVAALIGAALAVGGLFAFDAFFLKKSLGAVFASGVLPQLTGEDFAFVIPILVGSSVVLAAISAYVTLRAYVRT